MAFIIGTITSTYLTEAQWLDDGLSQALGGVSQFGRWKRHTLKAAVMTAAEYDSLSALEGQRVSLYTTAYGSRNIFATYYGCQFEKLSGKHAGPVLTDVQAEFLVRV